MRTIMRRMCWVVMILGCLCLRASDTMAFSLPNMRHRPRIDGVLEQGEWREGVAVQGFCHHNSFELSGRQGTFHFGMDAENVYFAARTELPPKGIALSSRVKKRDGALWLDDGVEFLICPPDESYVYHFIVNSQGTIFDQKYRVTYGSTTHGDYTSWNPEIERKSQCQDGYWVMESRIALKDLGLKGKQKPGSRWRVMASRNWQHPWEQTAVKKAEIFCQPESMATMTWNPQLPHVSFLGFGPDFKRGDYEIGFRVSNPSTQAREVAYRITVLSHAAPRSLDSTVTVPAGGSVPVTLAFSEPGSIYRTISASFRDVASKEVLFERQVIYNPEKLTPWEKKLKGVARLEYGVYPYYGKIRARYGNAMEKVSGWDRGLFKLQSKDGKTVLEQEAVKTAYGFECEFPFKAVAGDYVLSIQLFGERGRTLLRKETFKVEHFPWEHNRIGCERLIIPPYKPLACSKDGRSVAALFTGYQLKDGFFAQVRAADTENILAAPICLTINGQPVRETSFRLVETSPDRVRTESTLQWQGGQVIVKGTLDYDGFYRFTMDFRPQGKQKIDSAVITVPFKKEFSQYFHSTCSRPRQHEARRVPAGHGVVWGSSQSVQHPLLAGNFRPYVWLGTLGKGLCWMSETDRHWSLDSKRDALDIVSHKDRTELRIHLVNQPVLWDAPFTLEQAFQATPVKPQPSYRRKLSERRTYPNSWNLTMQAGSSSWGSQHSSDWYPLGKDYSFVNYLTGGSYSEAKNQQVISDYIARHKDHTVIKDHKFWRHEMTVALYYASQAKYQVPYLNPRGSYLAWPDYRTYMDEWFCSEYRAKNEDMYNNTPTKSYQDMILYYVRKLVREGMDGLYYDDILDWPNVNPVTGPAYRRKDGMMQPYFDIFDMRELLRRTAVMLCQEKKVFPDGRPIFTCHMTNANVVPFLSFSTITLDLEDQYGSKDFQDRFREDMLMVCTLGLQAGTVPEFLNQVTGKNPEFVTRTMLAMSLAYDLPYYLNCGGVTSTFYSMWKKLYAWGYSTDEVTVTPSWAGKTIPASVPHWRITTFRKGRELIASVSSYGETADGTLDLSGLNVEKAINWETGATLPLSKNALRMSLKKHDVTIIHLTLSEK